MGGLRGMNSRSGRQNNLETGNERGVELELTGEDFFPFVSVQLVAVGVLIVKSVPRSFPETLNLRVPRFARDDTAVHGVVPLPPTAHRPRSTLPGTRTIQQSPHSANVPSARRPAPSANRASS
jgi:hypothetical protein